RAVVGPAPAPVHRPRGAEGRLRRQFAVAEGADGRSGRRPQRLPGRSPGGEAARADPVRTVDGAQFHRRQHRRRYRKRAAEPVAGVLRKARHRHDRAGTWHAVPRAARFQRHGDRAVAHAGRARAAADQSAHQLLLPLRTAGDERRRPER
ncbi:hypothetical protein OY671_012543, partial [Metschnikowia pulcherrima]